MSGRLLSATILALALCASPNVLRAQQAPVPVAINTVIQAPTVLSAPGTVTVATGGLPAVGLTIQGTGSGITAAIQGQATPGGIWTTISAVPYGGGAAVTSISANGFWTINVSAYVAVRLNATALASGNLGVVFGSATPLAITVVNPDGTPVGGGSTIGVVSQAGSNGSDYSANPPTLPNVGANFAASGPYASYVLVATVPAFATRNNVDIENTSGAQIAIIRDDGTANSGAAPVNPSIFSLAGGSGAGAQGGSWSSQTFKGRLQIYALSSAAQICVMVD